MLKKAFTIMAVPALLILLLCACGTTPQPEQLDATDSISEQTGEHPEQTEEEPVLSSAESAPSLDISTADDKADTEEITDMDIIFEKADEGKTETGMVMKIGVTEVPVTWEENASVDALKGLLPLTIQMSMYGGFEQVGSLGQSIVRDDEQTTTNAGDIVLYSGNQIVVFYGSNSWAYTKLGHINLSETEMTELLGGGDVTITIGDGTD